MPHIDGSILQALASLDIDVEDLTDIALASVLIYGALRLLRMPSNRLPLLGATTMLGVYFLARGLGLFLTEMLLRAATLPLIVVFAVAFQEDIRRAIVRWRHWQPRRGSEQAIRLRVMIDAIAETVAYCSAHRFGALIVLQGHEPIDSHLSGGIPLVAPMQSVLLQSIFDPRSPGHDGAVVIQDGRIVRLCAQLPLSRNHGALNARGTRHSAGLGLAEQADALVLIVSEERGVVSIAHEGRLVELGTPAELELQLERFLDATCSKVKSRLGRSLFRHAGLKLTAVAAATLGWFLFGRHDDTIEQTFVVPIEYRNISERLCLGGRPVAEASLTLSGPEPAFALLVASSLRVRVDLEGYSAGSVEVALSEANCVHPSDLRVNRIEPGSLYLQLVPCSRRTNGSLPLPWIGDMIEQSCFAFHKLDEVNAMIFGYSSVSLVARKVSLFDGREQRGHPGVSTRSERTNRQRPST